MCRGPLRVIWRNVPDGTSTVLIRLEYPRDRMFEFTAEARAGAYQVPRYAKPDGDGTREGWFRRKDIVLTVMALAPGGDVELGGESSILE